MASTVKRILGGIGILTGGSLLLCMGLLGPCWRAWLLKGILVEECPSGDVRPFVEINAYGLGRKSEGSVVVQGLGSYPVGQYQTIRTTGLRRYTPDLELVFPDGSVQPLTTDWDNDDASHRRSLVRLPDVPDGDYRLRSSIDSSVGKASVEAPLKLYAPALVHVLSDSPIYKPGQSIRFRSVTLHEGSLQPMDGRPGVWKVYDPSGELVLEEKAKAAHFGVASSSFPLADDASLGFWKVVYETGEDRDEISVEIKPFELPRFTASLSPSAPAFFPGDEIVVEGSAKYTSGAPLSLAPVALNIQSDGAWPPPPEWLLPQNLTTDAGGHFRVVLGRVPADLVGQIKLNFSARITDPTGDTLYGQGSAQLSEDRLSTSSVTELEDGLVPSTNNRVYLRVSTADGRPLLNTRIKVKRSWDEGDPGVEATTDADGVARLQLDPGEPVTIVTPALPVRRVALARNPQPVHLQSATEQLSGESLDVAGQSTLDRWQKDVESCAYWVNGSEDIVGVSLLIDPSGNPRQVVADGSEGLDLCMAEVLRHAHALSGDWRYWSVSWRVEDPLSPSFQSDWEHQVGSYDGDDPNFIEENGDNALIAARRCLDAVSESDDLDKIFVWSVHEGSTAVSWQSIPNNLISTLPANVTACAERALNGIRLRKPAENDAMGTLQLSVDVPQPPNAGAPPQPSTWQGFRYTVLAYDAEGAEQGSTHVDFHPGIIPDLRLRFSEVLVNPGDSVDLLALRGPNYQGSFPKELYLSQGGHTLQKFDFDPKKRTGTVQIPKDASGYAVVEYGGARALLYIRPQAQLNVALSTETQTFRPGEEATLLLQTTGAQGPVAAGVTLSGVDSTLATLATLPSPEEFARITVQATSNQPAFGTLDARALQTGQIHGDNAAQATVLRVSNLPAAPPGSESVQTQARGVVEVDGDMAMAFFALHAEVRGRVRAWEKSAAAEEVMTPKRMVEFWEAGLAAKQSVDPWGRPLHLNVLPLDLLALTDPRVMVADGTRLPEDVENWPNYVQREAP